MIELIPAIDIMDGKCVRLTKGDFAQKTVYGDDPASMARRFEEIGYKRLHLVDLDGARAGHIVNIATLKAIAGSTSLAIDFGGGIKTDADIEQVFDNGAAMATIGSVSVTDRAKCIEWIGKYGGDRIILGADVSNGKIAIHGWTEESAIGLSDFLDFYVGHGARNVLCTDISKDGMLAGPATELYKGIMEAHPTLHLIASGGVAGEEDIHELARNGIPAVVFGKAIYECKIDMESLWHWQNA